MPKLLSRPMPPLAAFRCHLRAVAFGLDSHFAEMFRGGMERQCADVGSLAGEAQGIIAHASDHHPHALCRRRNAETAVFVAHAVGCLRREERGVRREITVCTPAVLTPRTIQSDIGEGHWLALFVHQTANEPLFILLHRLHNEQRIALLAKGNGIESDTLADGLRNRKTLERLTYAEVFQLIINERYTVTVGGAAQVE